MDFSARQTRQIVYVGLCVWIQNYQVMAGTGAQNAATHCSMPCQSPPNRRPEPLPPQLENDELHALEFLERLCGVVIPGTKDVP